MRLLFFEEINMSINEEYQKLIEKRESIEGDIDYDNNPVIQEMIKLLTDDINATVSFLDAECTESQFVWMSEIFDEIAEYTRSKAFIHALRRTAQKYPNATEQYNIDYFIDSAEDYVDLV